MDRFGSKIANIMAEKAMTTNCGNTTVMFATPWVAKVISSHDDLQVHAHKDNSGIVFDIIRAFGLSLQASRKSWRRIPY
jgi:hypothetical protein